MKRQWMKKVFSIAMSVSMIVVGAVPAFAATSPFKDVATTHWALEKITFASEKKIISGYPGGLFKPEGLVTCEEAMSMLYGTLNAVGALKDAEDHTAEYKDVLDQAKIATWARKVVSYGLKYEILTAADISTFVKSNGGGRPALREETAMWAGKAMTKNMAPGYRLTYIDAANISAVAVPFVDLLYRQGVMTGDNKGQFLPKTNVKRSEFASVCKSVFECESNATFDAAKEIVNISGTVTAVDGTAGSVTLKLTDGSTSKIIMNTTNIYVGNSIVVGYVALPNTKVKMQITNPAPNMEAYIISANIKESKPLTGENGSYYALRVSLSDGSEDTYIIDENTSIFDSKGGSATVNSLTVDAGITMLCDGVKILEIKTQQ